MAIVFSCLATYVLLTKTKKKKKNHKNVIKKILFTNSYRNNKIKILSNLLQYDLQIFMVIRMQIMCLLAASIPSIKLQIIISSAKLVIFIREITVDCVRNPVCG